MDIDGFAIKVMFLSPCCDDAIVRINGRHYIIHVTAGLDKRQLSEFNVEQIIGKLGYKKCGAIFWHVKDAQKFIANKYVEFYKQSGFTVPTHKDLTGLIKHIPLYIAINYLDHIENELLPRGRFDVAKTIAHDLHDVESIRNDPVVLGRVERILEICSNENE
jgi:hypothetical protein